MYFSLVCLGAFSLCALSAFVGEYGQVLNRLLHMLRLVGMLDGPTLGTQISTDGTLHVDK